MKNDDPKSSPIREELVEARKLLKSKPRLPSEDLKPYSVTEAMALTGYSRQTVIRMFERERGVLIRDSPETMHKRKRRTIRIPQAVFERVVRALSV